MTKSVRYTNRFLRPKRDHITPLDRIQGKLRSFVITSTVLLAGSRAEETKQRTMPVRRRERAALAR